MIPALLTLVGALAADSLAVRADRTALPDSSATSPRIVKVFEEFVVRRSPLHDPFSSQAVQLLRRDVLRRLPVDDLTAAVGLRAGVVVRGEQLHVRGGRAGELRTVLEGIPLDEPLRNRPMEVPSLAIESADLVSGGLEAGQGGGLAGVLHLRTVEPQAKASGEILWQTDAGLATSYDKVAGRFGGPLFGTGLGAVVTAEARLDDTHLPEARTQSRHGLLGGSFGWRADNLLLAHARVARLAERPRVALDVLASRRVTQPWDPMWSLDGWTSPSGDPQTFGLGPIYRAEFEPGLTRYRAADHLAMTDDRRLASVLSVNLPGDRRRQRLALGWTAMRRITSVGGRDDESYLGPGRGPVFGLEENVNSDPFYVYWGDEPYFQRATTHALHARWDGGVSFTDGGGLELGGGGRWESVRLRELDLSGTGTGVDSLRAFTADAPGAFAYAQARWVFEGLVVNAGLRGEWFTPGGDAGEPPIGETVRGRWSLMPRLGVAYPISTRDVLSLSYFRIDQPPAREFLYDSRDRGSSRTPFGNPALDYSSVTSWQASLKHLIGEEWALQAGIFYRDLFGQIGARYDDPDQPISERRYRNADEGNAEGFELSLLRVPGPRGLVELHYTYLHARGVQSREEGPLYGPRLGVGAISFGDHPLDWDRRHSFTLAAVRESPGRWAYGLTVLVGSGLPWTPRERRQFDTDPSLVNSRRLPWEETTSVSARLWPGWLLGRRIAIGLEVRNLTGRKNPVSSSVDGYPHPYINTVYDDYGAFRTETGEPGAAYWEDGNSDGRPGWVRIHDPRLFGAPRAVRLSLSTGF